MSADGSLPMGVTEQAISDPTPRRTDDDGFEPHRAGDDEPERLACRQCGKLWDEPRLSPDGVCPFCQEDLEER